MKAWTEAREERSRARIWALLEGYFARMARRAFVLVSEGEVLRTVKMGMRVG